MKKNSVVIGKNSWVTPEMMALVARKNAETVLHKSVQDAMKESRKVLLKFVNERTPIYGLNTQFGNQVDILDNNLKNGKEDYYRSLTERQRHLIRSHNVGLGEEVPQEIVRAAMLLRAHCLAQGHSGVRPAVVESLLNLLNKGVHPVICRYGSIGASGDLIPLSAIAAALTGEDTYVYYKGKKMKAPAALGAAKLKKFQVELREGLALINGTSFSTAIASLAMFDLQRLFPQMLSAIAMSLESLRIVGSPYNPFVHALKHHQGEMDVNAFMVNFWKGNKLIKSLMDTRKENFDGFDANGGTQEQVKSLQDFYSLRSVPQGFGPFKENLERARVWIENEMNAVSDNPVVSVHLKKVYHCANFMGYYITEASDVLKMDIAQASSWIHAILANMVHPRKSFGLPTNLVPHPERDSGFRPIQLLAASLAVQNRKFAQSQQAFMLSTEGDNQDVNSLSAHAAFDLREALQNLERLVAILFLASSQALELRGISKAGTSARRIHKTIREKSDFVDADRPLQKDIHSVVDLMQGGFI